MGDVARVVACSGQAQGNGGAGGETGAAGQGCHGVLGADNVGLHRGLGGVGGVAGGHDALVECTLGTVAVVAADTEDDGAFLAHWVVAADGGAGSAVVSGQAARGSIAASNRPLVGTSLDNGGKETSRLGRVRSVQLLLLAGEKVVLEL